MITLATLGTATQQQVFDQAVDNLLKLLELGTKSVDKEGGCHYRLGELRCAAGCFIGDGEYENHFEGLTWKYMVEFNYAPKDHERLIANLQVVHDETDKNRWVTELVHLANKYDLATLKLQNQ